MGETAYKFRVSGINPEPLVRLYLLQGDFAKAEGVLERWGSAMTSKELLLVKSSLEVLSTGKSASPEILKECEQSSTGQEFDLYMGLLFESAGEVEKALPRLDAFLSKEQWGKELAAPVFLRHSSPECVMCRQTQASTFNGGLPLCERCDQLQSDPTWPRQPFHSPTEEQRQYLSNLIGEEFVTGQSVVGQLEPDLSSALPFIPEQDFSTLLDRLDPKARELWRRTQSVAQKRGHESPGTGDLGVALSEGEFDPRYFSSLDEQRNVLEESRSRGPEQAGRERAASRELVWLLNVANWLGSYLPPYDTDGIAKGDLIQAYQLTLNDPGCADGSTIAALIGSRLSAQQRDHFEQLSTQHPDSLFLHYALSETSNFDFRPSTAEGSLRHTLWLIRHKPATVGVITTSSSDRRAYREIVETWSEAIHSHIDDAKVLAAAADVFCVEEQALSAALLARCRKLEPENPDWARQTAHLFKLMNDDDDPSNSKEQLKLLEEALEGASDFERDSLLTELVVAAYDAGELKRAEEVAQQLLSAAQTSKDWNSGNAFHKAHLVLGLLALDRGDMSSAKEHLLDSGRTKGSPQLDSFGPNMRLAKALLEAGEPEAVLSYLELCSVFWKAPELEQWQKEIREGSLPDFGANLSY